MTVSSVLANFALSIPIAFAGYLGVLGLQRFDYPSHVSDEHLVTSQPVKPGQVIDVSFTVVRRKTCDISIARVMERKSDKREFSIAFVLQMVEADTPPYPRNSFYRVQVPPELSSGAYVLFGRYRYYCNALDLLFPWIQRTNPIPIEVQE